MGGRELEEDGPLVGRGRRVRRLPRRVDDRAEDDARAGPAVGGGGDAGLREGLEEGAGGRVAGVRGQARAGDEEQRGRVPVEDLLRQRVDAEAVLGARVERAQAVEELGAREEGGELAEEVGVEDLGLGGEERGRGEGRGRVEGPGGGGGAGAGAVPREVEVLAEEEVLEERGEGREEVREGVREGGGEDGVGDAAGGRGVEGGEDAVGDAPQALQARLGEAVGDAGEALLRPERRDDEEVRQEPPPVFRWNPSLTPGDGRLRFDLVYLYVVQAVEGRQRQLIVVVVFVIQAGRVDRESFGGRVWRWERRIRDVLGAQDRRVWPRLLGYCRQLPIEDSLVTLALHPVGLWIFGFEPRDLNSSLFRSLIPFFSTLPYLSVMMTTTLTSASRVKMAGARLGKGKAPRKVAIWKRMGPASRASGTARNLHSVSSRQYCSPSFSSARVRKTSLKWVSSSGVKQRSAKRWASSELSISGFQRQ